MLKSIQGTIADGTLMEQAGTATATVTEGPHQGHTVTLKTHKHQCGAYAEDVDCNCEGHWHNQLNGCWQQGHQRDEHGDKALAAVVGKFYKALDQ